MFINDVNRREEIRTIAIERLKKLGVKYRVKKTRPVQQQVSKFGKKFFKIPLQYLETETVTLKNGQQLSIPKRIHELCSIILLKVQTEGIFRKEGSRARQNEIKLLIDRGCALTEDHHVIDLAVILKCFLRELPDSLIPQGYHELFLRCSIIENKLHALLLACLLLPSENLNVLSYIMQFFNEVASYSLINKMNLSNLSILIGPNILPVEEKIVPKPSLMVSKICNITKLLIEHSSGIGVIPDDIIEQIGQSDIEKRKKNRRRSGSLTRMLNGLKKIVTNKTESESPSTNCNTPDLLLTPPVQCNAGGSRRRKSENGISLKKKKEIITKLPDCALLNTPFTPSRTPISKNPNGTKIKEKNFNSKTEAQNQKDKKVHWYSMKNLKDVDGSNRNNLGPKSLLERRWSVVSNAANFRKKNRNSCGITKEKELIQLNNNRDETNNDDFITVPKVEYEEFKNRVSAIERRISLELEHIVAADNTTENDNNFNKELDKDNNIENVQLVYKQTLESTSSLNPTTDKVAKRLSRDLRIRKNDENIIFRSPSERRIGSIRRRSSEREKKNKKINRHKTWHVSNCSSMKMAATSYTPRNNALFDNKENAVDLSSSENVDVTIKLQQTPRRRISTPTIVQCSMTTNDNNQFSSRSLTRSRHSSPQLPNSHFIRNPSDYQLTNTTDFNGSNESAHMNHYEMNEESCFNNNDSQNNVRASLAKLRKQNMGMVKAKAKIFDHLKDAETSCLSNTESPTRKISENIEMESEYSPRNSYGNTTRFVVSKSKYANMAIVKKQRLQQIGRQYLKNKQNTSSELSEDSFNISSPSSRGLCANMPYVKTPLALKTPKRLCRTPRVDKRTPFKILATPM